jgi:hypothetical protein
MEECLLGAAGLGWIDGIMMTYNYRLMHTDKMRRAVDACARAGIGLTAMKTQGGGQVRTNSAEELRLAGRFVQSGFTEGQAKLKAVWENPLIASICSQMPTMALLSENTAAAMNRTKLAAGERDLLRQHAQASASGYCAGCTRFCEPALAARSRSAGHALPDVLPKLRHRISPAAASGRCRRKPGPSWRGSITRRRRRAAPRTCPSAGSCGKHQPNWAEHLLEGGRSGPMGLQERPPEADLRSTSLEAVNFPCF